MQRLVLKAFQSPGDIVMLTAAVRDLHKAHPNRFLTDVRTSANDLWLGSPYVTPLEDAAPGTIALDMHYPLVHRSNERPFHFIHGYVQHLEQALGLKVPVTAFRGDIHLREDEKTLPKCALQAGVSEDFWILIAGGKHDFTAKWWNPANYQAVIDHFAGRIQFVQCGEKGHWHPELKGALNLVGNTSIREFVRLMHFARGVVCPVTFAMHLAAAVEVRPGRPPLRPCVVVAGGREPDHWEAYPGHQYLSSVGMLPCCASGGCWKSRCQLVGDGDVKDRRDLCERPIQVSEDLRIPQCLDMIKPEDVIRKIELYLQGEAEFESARKKSPAASPAATNGHSKPSLPRRNVLLKFRHGLGDAVQLTIVLRHLRRERPEWDIDVESLVGKHTAFTGLCRKSYAREDRQTNIRYDEIYELDWHECGSPLVHVPSTKPARCLEEVFRIPPRAEEFRYQINVSHEATGRANAYFAELCPEGQLPSGKYPVVLIHYQGNTSGDRKDLPHEVIRKTCEVVQNRGYVPVILDWDDRSPLIDQRKVFNPGRSHPLWGRTGTGDAATMAALISGASFMIGIDSGPLHVAGATSTPTIGVWTKNHPIHFFDLAENVLHLVPDRHASSAAGAAALHYFKENYRFRTYSDLQRDLPSLMESALGGSAFDERANDKLLDSLRTTTYGEEYYLEHKEGGLDYLHYGEWQQRYGRWLVESLGWQSSNLLDVGCACGSILRALLESGAAGTGVDLNEHMIQLGRANWSEMSSRLHICDAINLHMVRSESIDGIHSSQVAEHWKPELVPFILKELHRVAKQGALFFCSLDTEESVAEQNRSLSHDDPTHVCIKPLEWWHAAFAKSGWRVCSDELRRRLTTHPESYLNRYNWSWIVARRS